MDRISAHTPPISTHTRDRAARRCTWRRRTATWTPAASSRFVFCPHWRLMIVFVCLYGWRGREGGWGVGCDVHPSPPKKVSRPVTCSTSKLSQTHTRKTSPTKKTEQAEMARRSGGRIEPVGEFAPVDLAGTNFIENRENVFVGFVLSCLCVCVSAGWSVLFWSCLHPHPVPTPPSTPP